jgi:hypothetical protein
MPFAIRSRVPSSSANSPLTSQLAAGESLEAVTPPQSSIGLTDPINVAAARDVQRSPRGPR